MSPGLPAPTPPPAPAAAPKSSHTLYSTRLTRARTSGSPTNTSPEKNGFTHRSGDVVVGTFWCDMIHGWVLYYHAHSRTFELQKWVLDHMVKAVAPTTEPLAGLQDAPSTQDALKLLGAEEFLALKKGSPVTESDVTTWSSKNSYSRHELVSWAWSPFDIACPGPFLAPRALRAVSPCCPGLAAVSSSACPRLRLGICCVVFRPSTTSRRWRTGNCPKGWSAASQQRGSI